MAFTPKLSAVCNRCGKSRGLLGHTCFNTGNSERVAAPQLQVTFGKCPKCKKQAGNPLTHVCAPKSDFTKRKRAAERREQAAGRKKRQAEKHDYQACSDKDCPRSLCVAFRVGRKFGYQEGFDDGFISGTASGFASGYAAGAQSAAS